MCTIKHEDHAQCLKLIQKGMADPAQEPKVAFFPQVLLAAFSFLGDAEIVYASRAPPRPDPPIFVGFPVISDDF